MMRALTLWQPWASLMALDIKRNETRNRFTHVRGELAICAAANQYYPSGIITAELADVIQRHIKENGLEISVNVWLDSLPRGKVLCVVNLFDCQHVQDIVGRIAHHERTCGDYQGDRYAWLTKDLKTLREPVPVKGGQGFFFLPADVEAKVRAQL